MDNWAIILAAGSSRRMGTQKLLLPYGESTIIETVIRNVKDSGVDHIVVVLGASEKEVRETTSHLEVDYCVNRDFDQGMLSSVLCGIRSLPDSAGAALIYLGDQPGISPDVTDAILQAYDEELKGIVIPVFDNRRGHPLLVDMKYRSEVEKLDLEKGLRTLMHHFPEDVLEVEVEVPGILVDIDTREDYQKAINPDKS